MPATVLTAAQIRDNILSDRQNLQPDQNVDTDSDSDNFARASATGSAIEGLYGYGQWGTKQIFPDSADDENVIRHAALRNMYLKAATYASGTALVGGPAGEELASGLAAKYADGTQYVTTSGGTFDASGHATITLKAVVAGTSGNRATGDVLKRRELGALARLAGDVRAALSSGAARLPFALPIVPRWPDTGGVALFGEHDAALRQALLDMANTPATLQGTLNRVTAAGQVLYRYASPNAREYLHAWLAHLAYCAAQPDGPCRTVWYGAAERFAFSRVEAPLDHLAPLVALFVAGRRLPLRFFPKSAWAKANGGDADALGVWINDRVRGESDDAALEIAWRGVDLSLDERFGALSRIVFEPLIAHLTGSEA